MHSPPKHTHTNTTQTLTTTTTFTNLTSPHLTQTAPITCLQPNYRCPSLYTARRVVCSPSPPLRAAPPYLASPRPPASPSLTNLPRPSLHNSTREAKDVSVSCPRLMPSQRPEEEVEPAGKYGVAESYVRSTGPGKEGMDAGGEGMG